MLSEGGVLKRIDLATDAKPPADMNAPLPMEGAAPPAYPQQGQPMPQPGAAGAAAAAAAATAGAGRAAAGAGPGAAAAGADGEAGRWRAACASGPAAGADAAADAQHRRTGPAAGIAVTPLAALSRRRRFSAWPFASARFSAWRCGRLALDVRRRPTRCLASTATGLRGLPNVCDGSIRTRIFWRVASALFAIACLRYST